MSTLEALNDLLSMGFIQPEEYESRRAALGLGPSEPTSGGGSTSVAEPVADPFVPQTTSYEPYNGYSSGISGGYPDQTDYNASTTQHTFSTDTFASHATDSHGNDFTTTDTSFSLSQELGSTTIEANSAPTFVEPATNDFSGHGTYEHPSYPTATQGIFAGGSDTTASAKNTVTEDLKSLSHVFVTPLPDSSPLTLLSKPIPSDKALLVHRTIGAYKVVYVDADTSVYQALRENGIDEQSTTVFECGTTKEVIEKEMYWDNKSYVSPDARQKMLAGKIYSTRSEIAREPCRSAHFDERVIFKYQQSTLKRTYAWGDNPDPFNDPGMVTGLRLFNGAGVFHAFDPREVRKYHDKRLMEEMKKKHEQPGYTSASVSSLPKIKLQATPPFLLWSMLISQLKIAQSKVDELCILGMPQSSAAIWDRIAQSFEKGVCYFTGEPASYGSFLGSKCHSDSIMKLYEEIKAQNLQPGSETIKQFKKEEYSGSVVESQGTSDDSKFQGLFCAAGRPPVEEIIVYSDPSKKCTYGWPTEKDVRRERDESIRRLDICMPGASGRVSTHRLPEVQSLVAQLSQLNGPEALLEANSGEESRLVTL